MAKRTKTGTNVQKVRQQNAASMDNDVEFASETDVQAVRQQNQQSQQNKKF